ncbi:MAG: acetyl-CoA carboxylase biotin carboxyl carrier protein [Vulcanimicrobiaceae bacterium]
MDEKQTLAELLEMMAEHDLDVLKVKMGDATYELVKREPGVSVGPVHVASTPNVPAQQQGPSSSTKRITAPLTGVFYRASSPDTESFVHIGDRVEVGRVVCILEAMKLFNEIQSEFAGVITKILPQNGDLVSQGQDIFWIEP